MEHLLAFLDASIADAIGSRNKFRSYNFDLCL